MAGAGLIPAATAAPAGRMGTVLLCVLAGLAAPPAAAACDPPRPIRFTPGATAAEITGGVARAERDCYTIGAAAGQTMTVRRTGGAEDNIVFQLYRPGWRILRQDGGTDVDGVALPGAGPGQDTRAWSGPLPARGTYLLVVGTTRGGGDYRLRIEIR